MKRKHKVPKQEKNWARYTTYTEARGVGFVETKSKYQKSEIHKSQIFTFNLPSNFFTGQEHPTRRSDKIGRCPLVPLRAPCPHTLPVSVLPIRLRGSSLTRGRLLQALFQPLIQPLPKTPSPFPSLKPPIAMAQAPPPAFSDIAKSANDVCAGLGHRWKTVTLI